MSKWGKLKPYSQGDLDGLCGVYAVINSLRLVVSPGMAEDDDIWDDLFGVLIKAVNERTDLVRATPDGLNGRAIRGLFKVATRWLYTDVGVSVHVARKWSGSDKPSLSVVIRAIRRATRRPGCAVLVGTSGEWDHWTVIRGVSKRRLRVFDSGQLKAIKLKKCQVIKKARGSHHQKRHFLLWPGEIFFVRRS